MVPYPQVGAPYGVDVGSEEPVVPGHPVPAGHVAVVAAGVGQLGAGGAEHPQVRDRPVVAVEDVYIAAAVTVEVAQDEPVVAGQPASARDVAVVAAGHCVAGRAGGEQSDVAHRPVLAVEDDQVVTAVAVEVADEELVMTGQPAPAGDVAVI